MSLTFGTTNSAAADGVGALKSATKSDIENAIRTLLVRYNAEYILLFGSYVRGEETPDSDVDVVVFGGKNFKKSNIFAFAEDLRNSTNPFEIKVIGGHKKQN